MPPKPSELDNESKRSKEESTSIETKQSTSLSTVTDPLFKVTVFGRPIVKKNTQRVIGFGRSRRVIYSKKYLEWADEATLACLEARDGRDSINGLLFAKIVFYFKNFAAESDLSNCIEGIQDILQSTGVICNDKFIRQILTSKHFGQEPRTEVELYPYVEEL